MTTQMLGIGLAVPEHSVSQANAAELVIPFNADSEAQARVLRELYRRAGVQRRHSIVLESSDKSGTPDLSGTSEAVRQSTYSPRSESRPLGPTTAERMQSYECHAGPLACLAARRALQSAALEPASITHLITVSCSGFHAPGFDIELLQEVGLSPATARTHIGFMGCHGALNGLRVADAFLRADQTARVLLCCVELCSLHHQYGWSPDRVVSNALFADGAAAVVLTNEARDADQHDAPASGSLIGRPPHSTQRRASDESVLPWRLLASGSCVLPETQADMGWRIRDNGFEMTLSAHVPDLIKQHLRPWLGDWLGSHGLAIDEVGSWAFHPGGPRILSAAGQALGLQREQWSASESVLAEFGNMSSPTILFILDRLARANAPGPCVALAFGPGLTIEAALLDQ